MTPNAPLSLRLIGNTDRLRRVIDRPLAAVLLVVLALVANTLSAQSGSGTIEGRIQNAASGDYLINARVSVVGTNRVVFTDATGLYRIPEAAAGGVTLSVSYTGLDGQEVTVRVEPGSTVRQDFNLTSVSRYGGETVQLERFTVAATREMDAESLAINEQRYAANSKIVMAADAFG